MKRSVFIGFSVLYPQAYFSTVISQLRSINVSQKPCICYVLANLNLNIIAAHPNPTLEPGMVKAFAKRLRKQYGWTEEDLLTKASRS